MLPFWRVEMSNWDRINFGLGAGIDPTGGWVGIASSDDNVDSEADWNDERQPDEAQEWHDFDPDC